MKTKDLDFEPYVVAHRDYVQVRNRCAKLIQNARRYLREMDDQSAFRKILSYGYAKENLGKAKEANEIVIDGIVTYSQVNRMSDKIEAQALKKLD